MDDDEGKSKESIWAINPNWRGLFYGVLSFCGVAVSAFTLYEKWGNGWLEIFNEIRNGIVSSVVVVWFVFQVADWTTPRVKTIFINIINYIIMAWGDPYREAQRRKAQAQIKEAEDRAREEARAELEEQARKEAEAYQKRYNEELLKQGVTEEQIRQAYQLSGSIPPFSPPPFPR